MSALKRTILITSFLNDKKLEKNLVLEFMFILMFTNYTQTIHRKLDLNS